MTPAGIEPAQHINHCATAVPDDIYYRPYISRIYDRYISNTYRIHMYWQLISWK